MSTPSSMIEHGLIGRACSPPPISGSGTGIHEMDPPPAVRWIMRLAVIACLCMFACGDPPAVECMPRGEDCFTPDDEDCDGATPACPLAWSHHLGTQQGPYSWTRIVAAVTAPDGTLVVLVLFRGVLEVGTEMFSGPPVTDNNGRAAIVIARYDAAGALVASKLLDSGTDNIVEYADLAIDPRDGDLVLAGGFSGTLDLGGGPLRSSGYKDIFLARLTASGDHLWSKRLGDDPAIPPVNGNEQWAADVAVGANGTIAITGGFEGTMNLGGNDLVCTVDPDSGGEDVFVGAFDRDGMHLFSKAAGVKGQDIGWAVAVAPDGSVYAGGSAYKGTTFGTSPLAANGGFVVRFSGDGAVQFERGGTWVNDLAMMPSGDVVVARGNGKAGVSRVAPDGTEIWYRELEDGSPYDVTRSVSITADGHVWAASSLRWQGDWGTGVIEANGHDDDDIVIVRFTADGTVEMAQRYGDPMRQRDAYVASTSDGVYVGGTFEGSIDFAAGPLVAAGEDSFVVHLQY